MIYTERLKNGMRFTAYIISINDTTFPMTSTETMHSDVKCVVSHVLKRGMIWTIPRKTLIHGWRKVQFGKKLKAVIMFFL